MAIFKTRWFDRWARKQGLTTSDICIAVREVRAGLIDADLGGGLLKKRIRRRGQGKSAGFRTLIATNRQSRWLFVYGFAKSERSNIDDDDEEALKKLAAYLLALNPLAILTAVEAGELLEVNCDA